MHAILIKKIDQRPQAFITAFMGLMSAKLFISLILLLVVIYINREVKIPFAILFMLFYTVFTVLSTSVLFRELRSKKE
jgi:ABC-type polysaccharide/polyol phosphate export permease